MTEDGRELTLQLEPGGSHPPSSVPDGATEVTKQTLYLLDRFAVSDEFYHACSGMPCVESICT